MSSGSTHILRRTCETVGSRISITPSSQHMYTMEEEGEIRPALCVRCGRWGHAKKECDETTTVAGAKIGVCCAKCGQFGHSKKHCKIPPVKKPWCMRCAGFGHTKSACRAKRSVYGHNLERVARCDLCGLFGHTRSVCREVRTLHGDIIGRGDVASQSSGSESGIGSSSDSSCSASSGDSSLNAGCQRSCVKSAAVYRCDLSDV